MENQLENISYHLYVIEPGISSSPIKERPAQFNQIVEENHINFIRLQEFPKIGSTGRVVKGPHSGKSVQFIAVQYYYNCNFSQDSYIFQHYELLCKI